MSARAPRLPFEEPDLMEDPENLVRVDRAHRQVVVGIAAIVEVESAQHLFVEQPRHDLLDVLRQVVVAGIDQHLGLRPGLARQQQRPSPVRHIGVVERGLERLVFHQHPLLRAQGRMHRRQTLFEPALTLADVGGARVVRTVGKPQRQVARLQVRRNARRSRRSGRSRAARTSGSGLPNEPNL